MSNVVAVGDLKKLISYLPDGVKVAVDAVVRGLDPAVQYADNLALYAVAGISTTKAQISATAGARPVLFIGQSTGTKCWLHFHNNPSASVTEGVDVDFLVPLGGTSGQVTVIAAFGASWDTFWDTGITISASSATETSSAPANTPNAWVLYASS